MANSGDQAFIQASLHSARAGGGAKAPTVRLSPGLRGRGMAAAHGASEGGIGGRAHSSGATGGTAMDAFDRNGDPVVTGNFEQNPQYRGRDFLDTLLGNAVTGGGKLTEHGQEQKADSDILKQGSKLYIDAKMQGASDQDAFHHALATLGAPLGLAMMLHPSAPLASSTAAHQFLAGNAEHYGAITKEGQQLVTDDQGKALRMEDVPGFKTPPTKAQFVPGAANPTILGPDGTAKPVLDAQGNPVQGKQPAADAKAAAVAATYTKGVDGLPDQPTDKTPLASKAVDEKSIQFLRAVDPVMNALKDIQAHSNALGLVKGPVVLGAGKFLGVNGQGIDLSADIDIIKKNAPALMGSVYGKSIDAFMNAVTTANDAPSFVRAQTNKLMDDIRNGAQVTADNVTQTRGPPLPQSIANPLIAHGIVPMGYQRQEIFQQMGPAETARWKLQFAPQTVTDSEFSAAVQAAKNGAYGPPPAPNSPPTSMQPDLSRLIGASKKFQQTQQQQQQQGTASAVAGATNSPQKPPGSAIPQNPEIQPSEMQTAQPAQADNKYGTRPAGAGPIPPQIPRNSKGQPYNPDTGGVRDNPDADVVSADAAKALNADAFAHGESHLPTVPTEDVFGKGKVAPPGAGSVSEQPAAAVAAPAAATGSGGGGSLIPPANAAPAAKPPQDNEAGKVIPLVPEIPTQAPAPGMPVQSRPDTPYSPNPAGQ